MEQRDLFIGIDLGTSRSAIITNRGTRANFVSAVGYPRDLIGVRLLGDSFVVGDEACGKSYLDVTYPLEDGVFKESADRESDAARKLIAHTVQMADPKEGERICGIIGVPANASNVNKEMVLRFAREVMDVALVVSEPFLVAYGVEKLVNSIVIDIGAGTTDICALKGQLPQRDDQDSMIKAGDYIDKLLMESIQRRYPEVQVTKYLVRQLKERYAFVGVPAEKVVVTLRQNGKPVEVDITEDIRLACESIISEVVERTAKLIASFDPSYQELAVANIILAGGGSRISGLSQMIGDGLAEFGRVGISLVDDVIYAGCEGAIKLASELPPEYWEQVGETSIG
ncbi:hypothetical protein D5085_13220 [Ectothiorhodospiraceae bacterium BW-2]|nr:hypothetical protein D5085_13220 [Ectothiorhodospiraceae bacterium BW-2]